MTLKERIRHNSNLKKRVYSLLMPVNDYRPRWWFRNFIIPFIIKRGPKSIIRKNARLDLLPNHICSIGKKTIIESNALLNNNVGDILIGNNTIIGIGSIIIGPVEIGNNVLMAQHVVVSGLNHNYEDISIPPVSQGVTTHKISIEDNVWIGANCTITAGISIGKHSVVGAGSVVTKNIPSYCVAAGTPARVLKKYNFENKNWERYS